ncbi:MAG: LCP family protein [Actinomycetales bacterium]
MTSRHDHSASSPDLGADPHPEAAEGTGAIARQHYGGHDDLHPADGAAHERGHPAADDPAVNDMDEHGEVVDDVDVDDLDGDDSDEDGHDPDASDHDPGDLVPDVPHRAHRRLWPLVTGVLVVAVAAAAGGVWWTQRSEPQAAPAPAPAPERHSLFVSVATNDNQLVDGLLYVDGPDATSVVTPGTLIADVPTMGSAPLSAALPLGTEIPGLVVSDATGLRVDTSWTLSMDAMASIIDSEGGVTVDVDVPVQAGDVTLTAGPEQKLTGPQALTFATWTATGESGAAQDARLSEVSSAMLAALPQDRAGIEALLAGVPGSTTVSAADLAEQLLEVRASLAQDDFAAALLPTVDAPRPDVPDGLAVDRTTLAQLVSSRLQGLELFQPGVAGRVSLQNATGVTDMELAARRRLIDAGYDFGWRGLAQPTMATTIVMVPTNASDDLAAGRRVATTLGLPDAQVVASALVPTGGTAFVLLGEDFFAVSAQDAAAAQEAAGSGDDLGAESGEGAATDPAAGDPAAGDPAASDPAAGDPAAGAGTEPSPAEPGADPAAGDPAAADPAAADPAAADPAAGDPGAGG